jgi:hypothetical protein
MPYNRYFIYSCSLKEILENQKFIPWHLVEIFYPNFNVSVEMQTFNAIEEILTQPQETWSNDADLVWHTLGKTKEKIEKAKDQALKEICEITLQSIINHTSNVNVVYSHDNIKNIKIKI